MAKGASTNPELDALIELASDLFEPIGSITARRMFGGAGLYADGVIFALLADAIYLKTDAVLDPDFDAVGGCPNFRPFEEEDAVMSYRLMPEAALDDRDEAITWGRKALSASLRSRKPRKPKPAKAALLSR